MTSTICRLSVRLQSATHLLVRVSSFMVLLALCVVLGCGSTPQVSVVSLSLRGSVHGGQQPVTGADVQLYASGTTGVGSASQPLLKQSVKTDAGGGFSLTGLYSCPSPDAEVYIVAQGGNPLGTSGPTNSAIALMTMLGPCGGLTASTFISINEATTIASIWPVSSYMTSLTNLGSSSGDPAFAAAVSQVNELVDTGHGVAPGAVPAGYLSQTAKLNTLADIIASCINSSGGVAGDGSACGTLFLNSKDAAGNAPTDTIGSALRIAKSPASNVEKLFALQLPTSPFQPALAALPSDWSLGLLAVPPAPTVSPAPGTYPTGQLVTLSSSTSGAAIYYTVDGGTPTPTSPLYKSPITLSSAETVKAIAVVGGVSGSPASAAYAITTAHLIFGTQPSGATVGTALSPSPTVEIVDSFGNLLVNASTPVTLSIGTNPGGAALSGTTTVSAVNGVATFSGLSFNATGTGYALSASSAGLASSRSVVFTIAPPSITLTVLNTTINTGDSLTGSITLGQASSGSVSVALASSSPTFVSVTPAIVTIAAGQTTGSFTYNGIAVGLSTISATASGYSAATSQVTDIAPSIPSSLFGLTVLDFTDLTSTMQFGTTRSWDSYPNLDWSDANPSAGVYNFSYLDKFLALNIARGDDVIYTLGRTPLWASSKPLAVSYYGPGQCAPPANMTNYDNYIRALATHAAGKIKYWELWNEPDDVGFYCGDIASMVTMAQHASQIIKSIDPEALILSPAVVNGPGPAWLSLFLSAGGANYVDVIAFHGYSTAQAEDINSVVSNYRKVMAANGVASKPMWDTESSWAGSGNLGTPTMATQVGFIAKYYLLHWSNGVSRFVWYAYDGGATWGGLLTPTNAESAASTSYKETYNWMVGATLNSPCSANSNNEVWTCSLSRSNGYSAEAVWISNSTASFSVPAQYTVYRDLAGVVHTIVNHSVTVGDQPVLLETSEPSP
jgi:hypothetical protein